MNYNKLSKEEVLNILNEIENRKEHEGKFCWFGWQFNNDFELSLIKKAHWYEKLDSLHFPDEIYKIVKNYIDSLEVEPININRRGCYNIDCSYSNIFDYLLENHYYIFRKYLQKVDVKNITYLKLNKEIPTFKLSGIEFFTHKIKNSAVFDLNKNYKFYQDETCVEDLDISKFLEQKKIYVECGDYCDDDGREFYEFECCKNIDVIKDEIVLEKDEEEAYCNEDDFDFIEEYRSCSNCKNNKKCKYREEIYNSLHKTIPTKQNLLDYYLKNNEKIRLQMANEDTCDFKEIEIKTNLTYENRIVKNIDIKTTFNT